MKINLKKWFREICLGSLIGVSALLSGGCADVGYVGGSYGYYDYDYYPDGQVYFYPQGGIYYWNDRGHWRSGRRLPGGYELHEEHREHLRLHSREPWTEHHEEHGEFDRGRDHDRH
jgi:hypothetical protein